MKLDCGHEPSNNGNPMTTGYGTNEKGEKHCFECCAETDREHMRGNDKIALYLVPAKQGPHTYEVINWPGTLSIPVSFYSKGKHNWAGFRTNVWFSFEGSRWHGVQYGKWSDRCHCKKLKDES